MRNKIDYVMDALINESSNTENRAYTTNTDRAYLTGRIAGLEYAMNLISQLLEDAHE